ncbi:hypothetical protein LCGC14_2622300 [marine sediment metagenome]|uniref:UspA domain-containing protein n=1 Tax=marine sediment metagenome TaxID=412755 RepID=A0A0F9CDS0_9ZZZZ
MIPHGYYLKARCIQNSAVANTPPYIREIWDYLCGNANRIDIKQNGDIIKRGQLLVSYKDIIEHLCWYVGYRKMKYSENHMKKGMRYLTKELMITKEKKPRGVLITVCNYDYYQDPKNYERTNKKTNERTTKEPMENQEGTTEYTKAFESFWSAAEKYKVSFISEIIESHSVTKTIVSYSKSKKIDLIVMGAHGITGWDKLILGSVTDSLAHRVRCPVLIVR